MTEFQRSLTRIMYAALILALGLGAWGLSRPARAVRGDAPSGPYSSSPSGVTTTGTCVVRTAPELVEVTFGVRRTDRSATAALAQVKSRVAQTAQVLKSAGIDDKDLQTESFQLHPSWDDKRKVMLWAANESLRVRIRKIEAAGDVIDKVVASGVTDVGRLEYTVENLDELRAKGRAKAAEVARKKAKDLAVSLGGGLGRLVSVSEGYPGRYGNYYGAQANVLMKSPSEEPESSATELTLKPGEVVVTVVLTATYELE